MDRLQPQRLQRPPSGGSRLPFSIVQSIPLFHCLKLTCGECMDVAFCYTHATIWWLASSNFSAVQPCQHAGFQPAGPKYSGCKDTIQLLEMWKMIWWLLSSLARCPLLEHSMCYYMCYIEMRSWQSTLICGSYSGAAPAALSGALMPPLRQKLGGPVICST
jgi:hypothetical protein